MKHLFCSLFLLINIAGFSQEPPKAVVEVNKMNIVYRGAGNPLTLSMPGTISFEASAPGLKKIDDYGNYVMNPGSGLTVDIELRGKLSNREIVTAVKTLRIKDINKPVGTINGIGSGENCILKLTKEEIKNGKINFRIEDFLMVLDKNVREFKFKYKNKTVTNIGEVFDKQNQKIIEELKIGSTIIIFDIKLDFDDSHYRLYKIAPIHIQIIE